MIQYNLYVIFSINTTCYISKFRITMLNITRGIYAKYRYKSCYNTYTN